MTPRPVNDAFCGLSAALSMKVTAAVELHTSAGANVTDTVHVCDGVSVAPLHESFERMKSVF